MPSRLRPTASVAADAILVGDPARALLLAQELLERPKMSNHARGLWGYVGLTAAGRELTIQATGMGGPSAAIVLADLAELGVSRAIRIGTCTALGAGAGLGELLLVEEALAEGGSAGAFGLAPNAGTRPDPTLLARLRDELGGSGRMATVASFDAPSTEGTAPGSAAADLQTVAVLAKAAQLGLAGAALLIVAEAGGEKLGDEALERAAKSSGRAASRVLSA
jgi:purine-nucleoside phosphorylase